MKYFYYNLDIFININIISYYYGIYKYIISNIENFI